MRINRRHARHGCTAGCSCCAADCRRCCAAVVCIHVVVSRTSLCGCRSFSDGRGASAPDSSGSLTVYPPVAAIRHHIRHRVINSHRHSRHSGRVAMLFHTVGIKVCRKVAGPGNAEGVVCRGSRASLTADAATTLSILLGRGLGTAGRAVRRAILIFETVVNFRLHHGLSGFHQMRCVALNTTVEFKAKR